ncbi:MAG: hypothetical protein WCL37_08100 [Chrysiogenales bacterium]
MKGTIKTVSGKAGNTRWALLFVFSYTLAPGPYTLSVGAQERLKVKSEESLFLNLQKTGLGSLSEFEEKKRFLGTVQLEKEKLQLKMLRSIYESAFDYYRQGNYEEATELSSKILSIDPSFSDAVMLLDASNQLHGGQRVFMSVKLMIEDRFKSSLSLYNEGRIAEAYKKMEEVEKLSPNNIKAKYWLGRMKDDLKQYYFEKGVEAYQARNLKGALDNLYNALFIRRKDTLTVQWITRIEEELRQERANESLKAALEFFDISSRWVVDDQIIEDDSRGIVLVPEISFRIRNVGKIDLSYVFLLGVFRFTDNGKFIGEGYQMALRRALSPAGTSERITLKCGFGYRASSAAAFEKYKKEWRNSLCELFAKSHNSGLTPVKIFYVSRKIAGQNLEIEIK